MGENKNFRPMLLAKDNPNLDTLQYPVYAVPKLDGIRCLCTDKGPVTRTLKRVPNSTIRETLSMLDLEGLDGELIVGNPTDKDVYRNTNSVVMSHDKESYFKYHIFDIWNSKIPYKFRREQLEVLAYKLRNLDFIELVPHHLCYNANQVTDYEYQLLEDGYEGLILRNPNGLYKYGRTTMKEQNTYKLKQFMDSEAVVLDVVEEMRNSNEAETNELGRTKRATTKAGLVGKNTMGSLLVRDYNTKVEFNIGTGFSQAERQTLWNNRASLYGDIIKYKFFPVGIKDKPRHPVFLGFRNKEDI